MYTLPIARLSILFSAVLSIPVGLCAQTIGAGNQFSVFLCAPDGLSAAGSDYYGQLGNTTSGDENAAVPVSMSDEVTMVSVQQQQAIVLGADSTVWTWGQRVGTIEVYDSIPYNVPGLNGATQVAMGFAHAAALRSDSTVWVWGSGLFGQLGNGQMGPSTVALSPIQVQGISGAVAIAAGGYHTLVLLADGSVRSWGLNSDGQLGDGSTENRASPVSVIGPAATEVAAGNNHSLMLRDDGSIWGWGRNAEGQIGEGSSVGQTTPTPSLANSGYISVKAGVLHSLAIKSDGTAWAWGYNLFGRLGDGTQTDRWSPVQITALSGVVEISGGAGHSLARTSDGAVWAWGNNQWGQLSIGNNTNSLVPVRALLDCGFRAITEQAALQPLAAHPNPFLNEVQVDLPAQSRAGGFSLYDGCGRQVISFTRFVGERLLIKRDDLPAGVYFLQVRPENGPMQVLRLMAL